MTHYVILRHLLVNNVQAITGLTYGLVAPTTLLGYMHALSRKTEAHGLMFDAIGMVYHSVQVDGQITHNQGKFFEFNQRKGTNLTLMGKGADAGDSAPIIERGMMSLDCSLVLRVKKDSQNPLNAQQIKNHVQPFVLSQRLSKGTVTDYGGITVVCDKNKAYAQQLLMPGVFVKDLSEQLIGNVHKYKDDFEAFCALITKEQEAVILPGVADDHCQWMPVVKPTAGKQVVPLPVGYKHISENKQIKANQPPLYFAENVYGIGEVVNMQLLNSLNELLWTWEHHPDLHVAIQTP